MSGDQWLETCQTYSVPLGVMRTTEVRCPVPPVAVTDTLCTVFASSPP